MATPPDSFHHKQEMELYQLARNRTKRLIRMLEAARQDIYSRIAETDSFTNYRITALTGQIDQIIGDLNRQIRQEGSAADEINQMAKRHTEDTIAYITGRRVFISFDVLNLDVLRKFSEAELQHVTGLTNLEKDRIKSILFTKVGVEGQNPVKVARDLVGKDSSFTGRYAHIENIIRTETNHIYNAQSLEGIHAANTQYSLDLNKRIIETIDYVRNHPISLVINGQVKKPGDAFRATVSEVQAAAASMGRKGIGGIFWEQSAGIFTGMRLPAHYMERGIVVPTEQQPDPAK